MLSGIQEKLLDLMREFDEICQTHGIHYTLGGGTAIGGIRHKGFIPWDDDIDLFMTRENWNQLVEVFQRGDFPEHRILVSPIIDEKYTNNFGRYVTTDSASIHEHQLVSDETAGHVIDIFIFDKIRDSAKFRKRATKDLMLFSDLLNLNMGYSNRFDINRLRFPWYLLRMRIFGRKRTMEKLEKRITWVDHSGPERYLMGWGVNLLTIDADVFDQGYCRIPFENIEVEVVRNYYKYLLWEYSDEWYQIPSHDERDGHDAVMSDTLTSAEVRADYEPFMNKNTLRKSLISRKLQHLFTSSMRHKTNDEILEMQAALSAAEWKERIAALDGPFSTLIWTDQKAKNIAEEIIEMQCKAAVSGRANRQSTVYRYHHPVLLPLGEEILTAVVEYLMRTERTSKAISLIEVMRANYGTVGAPLETLEQEILASRKVITDFYLQEGDMDLAEIQEWTKQYPKNLTLARLQLQKMFQQFVQYQEEIATFLREHQELFADAGEYAKLWGDYWMHSDREKAMEEYRYAAEHTDNGLLQLELKSVLDDE